MLNVIVVSDDIATDIGPNCVLSHQHLATEVDLATCNYTLLNGPLCTAEEVVRTISTFNAGKFLLVAYSHGSEDALISTVEEQGYISIRNSYSFATSVVYTNSCRTGTRLMDTLAMAGCYGYVGYTDIVKLPENEQDDMLFIACENKGLTHFLNTEDSLTKSVEVMKQQYRKQYDDFRAQKMNVSAAFLLHNLGCLTLYDPQGVTRSILEQQD